MAENEDSEFEDSLRRVDVELFIVHPTLKIADISAALGLEPQFSHEVGKRRTTPKGTFLEGRYPDTRWRHSIEYQLEDQWFVQKISALLELLMPHKSFFHQLSASGGSAEIIIQFFCDGYLGDSLPNEMLAQISELKMRLGIECFCDPQN